MEKWAPIVAVPAVVATECPENPTVAQCSYVLFAIFAAWMLNASRGVATTCVTGENAADATRY